jgi:hypothetical protein
VVPLTEECDGGRVDPRPLLVSEVGNESRVPGCLTGR